MVVAGTVIFLGAVILGVVTMMRHDKLRAVTNGETNFAILQRRYASGEITKEQYEQARLTLRM